MTGPLLRLTGILGVLALAACNNGDSSPTRSARDNAAEANAQAAAAAGFPGATAPRTPGKTVSASSIGADGAQSAAALDTTTRAEKAQAAAPTAGGRQLGITIASLGDPSDAGFWMKTPLVKSETNGRLVNPANGKSANVRPIPLGGPASGGSQVSLPALQMLGVSLTDLPELQVYEG